MNVWVLDAESGVTLLYKAYLDMPVNEDLVSGLLTALNQFTMVEFKQPIESVNMGGLKWSYINIPEENLLFIAADEKTTDANILRSRLNVISQSFIKDYVEPNPDWREKFDGNIERFEPFKATIDEFYEQWLKVESVADIAEFYNLLGQFQQVFNMLINVIEAHVFGEYKENIYSKIEEVYTKFQQTENYQNEEELKKLTFTRDSGFNIIGINPQNCNMDTIKRELMDLLRDNVVIIKEGLGHLSSLNYFIEENILDYVINNLGLLKSLKLDKYLLQLFLVR